ncbi:hypothetical protein DV736_g3289, partial [Chaetothyriales sp. CBS 134916]
MAATIHGGHKNGSLGISRESLPSRHLVVAVVVSGSAGVVPHHRPACQLSESLPPVRRQSVRPERTPPPIIPHHQARSSLLGGQPTPSYHPLAGGASQNDLYSAYTANDHVAAKGRSFTMVSKWSWAFFLTTFIQALIVLAFESYVFGRFQSQLSHGSAGSTQARTITTFLTLYIFGFVYQLVLVWDALRLKNTLQVFGLVLYNVGLLIYGAVQLGQLNDAVNFLSSKGQIDVGVWNEHISADLRMKRRYLAFQVYIALLKFDFFFFLGFTVQFVVIVTHRGVEFALTIAAIPVTILILLSAAYFCRNEIMWGTIGVIILYLGGLTYFIFKLVRMYERSHESPYIPARKELTTFAVLTILLILATIINAVVCAANYHKGLRPYVERRKVTSVPDKLSSAGGPASSSQSNYTAYASPMDIGYAQPMQPVQRMEID